MTSVQDRPTGPVIVIEVDGVRKELAIPSKLAPEIAVMLRRYVARQPGGVDKMDAHEMGFLEMDDALESSLNRNV